MRVLKNGGQIHIADWGPPSNRLMRVLFYSVQLLDGFVTTADNVNGRLPLILQEGGFDNVDICENITTILGTLSLYKATKPHAF